MLRRTIVLSAAIGLALPALATAQVTTYKIDPAHTEIGFTIRHFVTKVSGRFDKFAGTVQIDPKDPTTLKAEAKIDAASIDTNNEKRDEDLRSANFFEVAKYPEITFTTKKATRGGDRWTLTGDLTMHGVTKEVALDVEPLGTVNDPWGNERAGFEAHGKLDRKAYGINWNKVLDQGGTLLGDDVDIVLRIEAVKEKPQEAAK